MCVKPNFIHHRKGPKWQRLQVPCGQCWACLKNRQNDLIAKVLMELTTCDWSFVATLTYDDKKLESGDKSAQMINKYHLKTMLARLRYSFTFKYLAAGEYGSANRRSHFHIAMFGIGKKPDIPPLRLRAEWEPHWPYGLTYFDQCDVKSVEYIVKYLTKGRKTKTHDDPAQEWVTYSKYPPLGTEYILALADAYVEERVFPRTFRVNPPGASSLNRRMQITGLSQHAFLHRIFTQWPEALELKKTDWMENATLRYKKWLAHKIFDQRPTEEQLQILEETFYDVLSEKTFTTPKKSAFSQTHSENKREWLQWLSEIEESAKKRNYQKFLYRRRNAPPDVKP